MGRLVTTDHDLKAAENSNVTPAHVLKGVSHTNSMTKPLSNCHNLKKKNHIIKQMTNIRRPDLINKTYKRVPYT